MPAVALVCCYLQVSQVHPEKGRDIAHSPTDYKQWREATEPYTIQV